MVAIATINVITTIKLSKLAVYSAIAINETICYGQASDSKSIDE